MSIECDSGFAFAYGFFDFSDEANGQRIDEMGGAYLEVPEDFDAADRQDCGADDDISDEMR